LRRVRMSIRRVTMAIYGLGCGGGGVLAIERALVKTPGVVRAFVNPATEMAYVAYDPSQTDPGELLSAVERVGFRADELSLR
jgi:P-type Cu+ transporter